MPGPLSPIQGTVVLCRVDPKYGMARFYSLMTTACRRPISLNSTREFRWHRSPPAPQGRCGPEREAR